MNMGGVDNNFAKMKSKNENLHSIEFRDLPEINSSSNSLI